MTRALLAEDVAAWDAAFREMEAEERDMLAAGQWWRGRPDLLGAGRVARRERVHCGVLAWLMDPIAPHGLGGKLLNEILGLVAVDPVPTDVWPFVRTKVEAPRNGFQADLIVEWPGGFVVFEAKVDDTEQDRQCERLFESFGGEDGGVLVFLTPGGRPPKTAFSAAAREAIRLLSFPQIRDCLDRLAPSCSSAPGGPAVVTYLATLQTEFR